MPSADDYRKLFAYNEKVLQSFFNALTRLSWETLSRNVEASHDSMKNIIIHILTVYNGWINYNAIGKSDSIPWEEHDSKNYHSMAQVEEFHAKVMKGVRGFMDTLTDSDLSEKISAPWMEGEHNLSDILMQVTLEQAHHLGEIIALLWQLNIEPPPMTWIDYT